MLKVRQQRTMSRKPTGNAAGRRIGKFTHGRKAAREKPAICFRKSNEEQVLYADTGI
jgi:hypothetical protein